MIHEADACSDHNHVSQYSTKLSVSQFMGYLKGNSSMIIGEIRGNNRIL
ncbi:hypothetical protein ERJ70_00295 [Sediminibacillus dalangtanensis]|uniref:Uncharacterized protein n=1 Tax=Sediminibacillus dalangtanensis TaxID=2729421 RepID=A0ABX7VWH5_9BACI|nr:hypothetical protein ERJ70_00295 [Sediminibacillus dalangtanensis]